MGRRENDRNRRTHPAKGRNEIRHTKVPGALRIRASGDETGGERTGRGRFLICSSYGTQETAIPSLLSVGTPGDKKSGPVENRFRDRREKASRIRSGKHG